MRKFFSFTMPAGTTPNSTRLTVRLAFASVTSPLQKSVLDEPPSTMAVSTCSAAQPR